MGLTDHFLRRFDSVRPHRSRRDVAEREHSARDRGATLVEYSLIVAAVVFVSIPAADYLTAESTETVRNDASCVSKRPPPPSCLIPAVTTSTSVTPPSVTTTTAGIPTTTAPPPPPSTAAWGAGAVATRSSSTAWKVTAPVTVTNSGLPLAGAIVQVRINIVTPAGGTYYANCVTDASGTCTILWDVPITNATQVRVTPTMITSDPPIGTLPSSLLFTCNNSSPTSCV